MAQENPCPLVGKKRFETLEERADYGVARKIGFQVDDLFTSIQFAFLALFAR